LATATNGGLLRLELAMKDEVAWQPSKFKVEARRISVGPTTSAASWLMTRFTADAYERRLPEHARGRLLDLGCGKVPLYAAYRPLVDEVTCVDWSEDPDATRHLDLKHDLNTPLPLESARYDTVILSDVLEHIRAPEGLLREVTRVLAPQGKLLLNVPFMYWLHEQPHDYFRYTEHALRWLVQQCGLEVVSLEALGSGPGVIADVAGKHLNRVPGIGRPVVRILQHGAWVVTRLPRVSQLLKPSSQAFPMGYFLVARKP
jgi:SAM-dependent methyltransferase